MSQTMHVNCNVRAIPISKRPIKINTPQREVRADNGKLLIPDGVYFFPIEWGVVSIGTNPAFKA